MFYLAELLRSSSPGGILSDSSTGLLPRGKGGTRIFSFCNKDQGSQNIKKKKITVNYRKLPQKNRI